MTQKKRLAVSSALRNAISTSADSRYRLAKLSGVSESTISKFMAGASLHLDSVDRLCQTLDLILTDRKSEK